jgi:hypothetical protein
MSEQPTDAMPGPNTQAAIQRAVKQEIEQEEERHRLFTADQFLAMQHIAQDVANKQFRRFTIATSNVIISVVALLSSALGLVVALAWNKAVTDWLRTITIFDNDPLAKEFAYAGGLTVLGVMAIGVLGYVTRRLRGENLLDR